MVSSSKKIKKIPGEPEIKSLWLERSIGRRGYLLISFSLPAIVIEWDYIVITRVAFPILSRFVLIIVYGLSYVVLVLGLLLWRKVYDVYLAVLPKMLEKIEASPEEIILFQGKIKMEKKDVSRYLKGFGIGAGSDQIYSIINMITAFGVYVYFQFAVLAPKGIYYGVLSPFTVILSGGMIGPMATIMMFFIVFCALIFRGPRYYNLGVPDKCGGFRSLSVLGMWASLAAAVAPAGVPITFLIARPQVPFEISLNISMILFIFFCVLSFFFVPLFFLHSSMKFSRRTLVERIYEENYRKTSKIIEEAELEKKIVKTSDLLRFFAEKEIVNYATATSDWPIDYAMILKVIFGALLSAISSNLPAVINFVLQLVKELTQTLWL